MRGPLAVLTSLVLLAGTAGCGLFGGSGASRAVEDFAAAWTAGDDGGAAAFTDDAAAAAEVLTAVRDGLDGTPRATVAQVRESEGSAQASLDVVWDLGEGRTWTYVTEAALEPRPDGDGWRVRFDPTVVHPQLGRGQTLAVRTEQAPPAPVVDRNGAPLIEATPVVSVLLDRTATGDLNAVTAALAAALGPIDPAITQQSITDGAARTPDGQAYVVAVLRETDYRSIRDAIYSLPGVRFVTDERLLAPSASYGRQVLPAIRTEVAARLEGTPGWSVALVGSDGGTVESLTTTPPTPGTTVGTGLDRAVQTAAEDAVDPVVQQAMIVAIAPSTGQILTVAQNDAADADGALALTGRYPPGSTFKIVTAAAGLDGAGLTADTPVACPATLTVQGRPVPNIGLFALGTVPLRDAFANSCNTTFAQIATDLPADALPVTALEYGLGADFAVPGIVTVTGAVPPSDVPVQRAENGFGQGQVLATPLGMALVAATVAHGAPVVPQLITELPTEVTVPAGVPDPAVAEQLRRLMRAVVTSGHAPAVAGLGEVHGKTGTAEFTGEGRSHGWFIGFRGDLAFAVLVVDGGSSSVAVDVAGRFLGALPQ